MNVRRRKWPQFWYNARQYDSPRCLTLKYQTAPVSFSFQDKDCFWWASRLPHLLTTKALFTRKSLQCLNSWTMWRLSGGFLISTSRIPRNFIVSPSISRTPVMQLLGMEIPENIHLRKNETRFALCQACFHSQKMSKTLSSPNKEFCGFWAVPSFLRHNACPFFVRSLSSWMNRPFHLSDILPIRTTVHLSCFPRQELPIPQSASRLTDSGWLTDCLSGIPEVSMAIKINANDLILSNNALLSPPVTQTLIRASTLLSAASERMDLVCCVIHVTLLKPTFSCINASRTEFSWHVFFLTIRLFRDCFQKMFMSFRLPKLGQKFLVLFGKENIKQNQKLSQFLVDKKETQFSSRCSRFHPLGVFQVLPTQVQKRCKIQIQMFTFT